MIHQTTIEINEVETEVKIDYTLSFGEITINQITEVQTGNAIAPDKDGSMTNFQVDCLYEELFEWNQNAEQIELENHYQNI